MQQTSMLIHGGCRLRAKVAIRAVEIARINAMLAGNACECHATIHRFGCVIPHQVIVVLPHAIL
jgi:hypothetical protein